MKRFELAAGSDGWDLFYCGTLAGTVTTLRQARRLARQSWQDLDDPSFAISTAYSVPWRVAGHGRVIP